MFVWSIPKYNDDIIKAKNINRKSNSEKKNNNTSLRILIRYLCRSWSAVICVGAHLPHIHVLYIVDSIGEILFFSLRYLRRHELLTLSVLICLNGFLYSLKLKLKTTNEIQQQKIHC